MSKTQSTLVLLLVLWSTHSYTEPLPRRTGSVSGTQLFSEKTFFYDMPMSFIVLPWLDRCGLTIVGFDFKKGEILSFIHYLADNGGVAARYYAALRIEPTEFFGNMFESHELGDRKMDDLSKVMVRLSRIGKQFGQQHYIDGKVSLRAIGKTKLFTEQRRSRRVARGYGEPVRYLCNVPWFPIIGGDDFKRFQNPKILYAALSTTIQILVDGYEMLQINSDQANRKMLSKHIASNARVISREFNSLFEILRTETFHLIEIGHFFNTLRDLVRAIDQIIIDDNGASAGIIFKLNEIKN